MHCSHDKESNLTKYEEFISEAAKKRVRLVVFPEVSVQGYLTRRGDAVSPEVVAQLEYYWREAEPVPGPTTARIGRLAREYGMVIQIGMAEVNHQGTSLYNSAVILGADGVIGVYRKVHNRREYPIFRSGNRFPVFDTPVGRIGAFICADLGFPECMRALALEGAEILTMSTAFPMSGNDPENDYLGHTYEIQAEAAAMANQVWIVQSNQVMRPAKEGAENYYGHSRIVSCDGLVVASCGYEEALVVAEVNARDGIRRQRSLHGDRLQQRCPELYGVLSDDNL
jgi:predicted amidohydrolase